MKYRFFFSYIIIYTLSLFVFLQIYRNIFFNLIYRQEIQYLDYLKISSLIFFPFILFLLMSVYKEKSILNLKYKSFTLIFLFTYLIFIPGKHFGDYVVRSSHQNLVILYSNQLKDEIGIFYKNCQRYPRAEYWLKDLLSSECHKPSQQFPVDIIENNIVYAFDNGEYELFFKEKILN